VTQYQSDDGLRLYPHPGKYQGETMLTPYLHALSLEGCDEEASEGEGCGRYGLMRGPFAPSSIADVFYGGVDLTAEELAYLAACAGCILSEDSQGFVTAQLFDAGQDAELMKEWIRLEARVLVANDDGENY